jgi:multiple sugar transport system permease protein
MIDQANAWQRFWHVTLPMIKPTIFTVVTLGLIGTWQVFDQIYTGTQGGPAKTTLTPAYLSFNAAFNQNDWGEGAAIAFILFAIIVVMTALQRWVLRDKDEPKRTRRGHKQASAVEVQR